MFQHSIPKPTIKINNKYFSGIFIFSAFRQIQSFIFSHQKYLARYTGFHTYNNHRTKSIQTKNRAALILWQMYRFCIAMD